MKKILGLDLGTNSIGWALVNEAENENEKSSIIRMGVRVNPLTVDEQQNFEKGKSITTNAERTSKRGMRRNLQRYKLRREKLIKILKEHRVISQDSILSENGKNTTFETLQLRAKAANEKISLHEFARVLLLINKKRGYKSSRKAKGDEEGVLIDGMEVAKYLADHTLTPGQYSLQLLQSGKRYLPDFYRSDLQAEFDKIWTKQVEFYPEILTEELKQNLYAKNEKATWAIAAPHFIWTEKEDVWDEAQATKIEVEKKHKLLGIKREGNLAEQKIENYHWRVKGLSEKLHPEELIIVLQKLNGQINSSSGYLGAISDRSKELYFRKQTIGEYQLELLIENKHTNLRNMVFYRQDYLDEFNTIWEKQAEFHELLTEKLKTEIRDKTIFYQRRLKSQKGLISFCEFENKEIEIEIGDRKKVKTVGSRVIPRSSPLFQEFKIWQVLNNIIVSGKIGNNSEEYIKRELTAEEKEILAKELSIKEKLSKDDILKLLFKNPKGLDLNYPLVQGNLTQAKLFNAYKTIVERTGHNLDLKKTAEQIFKNLEEIFLALHFDTSILYYDSNIPVTDQSMGKLWHLLYSFEGDNSLTGNENLINRISELYGFDKEYATIIANVTFQDDYGALSTKAIYKILPHLKNGYKYDKACEKAGYRHSKHSLTTEEIENKIYKDKLEILPKNHLRNPVVEKILNQMVNVVNALVDTYGKPDEIRIELARDLKRNMKERADMTKLINANTRLHEEYKKELEQPPFSLSYISRTDIIRFKLWKELEQNGYRTLYSNTYISPSAVFSGDFDIEHIIPQSRMFDDSFSNKTLELRDVNLKKGNFTAFDFIKEEYGETGNEKSLDNYLLRIEKLFKLGVLSRSKYNKLKMSEKDIPDDFLNRDLRDTQYIAKYAKTMLNDFVKSVVSTTGSITDTLREDWQLIDVMKELNWNKYEAIGLTYYEENREGKPLKRIKDWTKRNDHRHHAMDALTVAFTKSALIQLFNNMNASLKPNSNEYALKKSYMENGKVKPPIPLNEFRAQAAKHLENIIVSTKAKNKVVTNNVNTTQKKGGLNKKNQQTPRGQLHLETIYGSQKRTIVKEELINTKFDIEKIKTVTNFAYREALLKRLLEFGSDPKKAFGGKNAVSKKPIYLDEERKIKLPEKVKTLTFETIYTIRKDISPDLKIEKVVDKAIRDILQKRLQEYNDDAKQAFSNLEENPIYLNKEKGITIKRVTITGISNSIPLHDKRDKDGNLLFTESGRKIPVDFVNTGNNHHVAIYRKPFIDKEGNLIEDENGNIQYELDENVVSFYEAVTRKNQGVPIIDKEYKREEGYEFLFSMKQNEYFIFPNEKMQFYPKDYDEEWLKNPENYSIISPNLFRVQKFTMKDYIFRHHLETNVENNNALRTIAWERISNPNKVNDIIKVRVNHIGQIVEVGEE